MSISWLDSPIILSFSIPQHTSGVTGKMNSVFNSRQVSFEATKRQQATTASGSLSEWKQRHKNIFYFRHLFFNVQLTIMLTKKIQSEKTIFFDFCNSYRMEHFKSRPTEFQNNFFQPLTHLTLLTRDRTQILRYGLNDCTLGCDDCIGLFLFQIDLRGFLAKMYLRNGIA